jgi:hypothetical protein
VSKHPVVLKLLVVLVLCAAAAVHAASQGKVDICHIPPGNPANAHTINVSVNAVPAHLAHGDTLGACGTGVSCPSPGFCVTSADQCSGGTVTTDPGTDCAAAEVCCTLGA